MHGLRRERIAVVLFAEIIVAINHRAARRRKSVGVCEIIESSQRAAGRINRCGSGNRRHLSRDLRNSGVRIASHVAIFKHILIDWVRIIVAEPVSKIVTFTTKLRLPADSVEPV